MRTGSRITPGGKARVNRERNAGGRSTLVGGAVTAAAVTTGLAALQAGPGITALGPVRRRFFPRLAGQGHDGHVAVTFDDGPDPATTPAFLDVLAAHEVNATFFMLGPMVAKEPRLAAEIAAAGHEVAVHGWQHRYTILRGPRAIHDDLARTLDTVAQATGTRPRFYRPPYGVLSTAALVSACDLGLTPVLWGCWGREWAAGATPASVYQTLAASLAPGSCVLLHDSDCTSPAGSAAAALGALPRLLQECSARGLRAGSLSGHGL